MEVKIEEKKRLERVFYALLSQNAVKSKGDFAKKVGRDRTSMSCAFAGRSEYLTTGLFNAICTAFPQISRDYLFEGVGEPLRATPAIIGSNNIGNNNTAPVSINGDRLIDELAEQRKMTQKAQEQIDRLLAIIEKRH